MCSHSLFFTKLWFRNLRGNHQDLGKSGGELNYLQYQLKMLRKWKLALVKNGMIITMSTCEWKLSILCGRRLSPPLRFVCLGHIIFLLWFPLQTLVGCCENVGQERNQTLCLNAPIGNCLVQRKKREFQNLKFSHSTKPCTTT